MSAFENNHFTPQRVIDVNADLGEGCPNDRVLLQWVTSASICCGFHAGSPEAIQQTLRDAGAGGVVVGAHPGYPDRECFGRREQAISSKAVRQLITDQVAAFKTMAAEAGVAVRFLKPHGALYNQAQRQAEVAHGVVAAASELEMPLLGQPATLLERLAGEHGIPFVSEGFPDRRYRDDGSLVPRDQPDAILHDPFEMESQLLQLVAQGRIATLCIHGDDPRAVANAQFVRSILERHRILVRSFLEP
jgi:UPF0271 protein